MGGVVNINSNPGLGSLSQYAPKACMNLTAKPTSGAVRLKWEDPEDYTTTDNYLVEWAYTRIVRKTGSYPVDENDGTVVVTSSTKNQYKNIAYTDSGLTNYTKYYYRAFSCSTDDVFNHEQVQVESTPIPWKVMTVNIDLNNSNPVTCGSYADDAVNMESGKTESAITKWKEFFKYKPCLFKDGKVVGYLNPNDYTKFENGSPADITSGKAGDVMIQFPRRGVKISRSGKVVKVSMTDNPNDSNFKYYAHQRGSADKDYFYMGVYLGYVTGNKLRSLSNKTPSVNYSLNQFDSYGKNNGTGYGCLGWFQWLFVQVMYVLQFKGNLDSQSTIGYGCTGDNTPTGSTNTKGLFYGTSSSGNSVKAFGLEDLWGHLYQFVNNFYSGNYHVWTTTDDTITDVSKYTDNGSFGSNSSWGNNFYTLCIGTTEAGFVVDGTSGTGSSSTYFCDSASFYGGYVPGVGGGWGSVSDFGLFYFWCSRSRVDSYSSTGSRLGYL